jgi:hypothetical protein
MSALWQSEVWLVVGGTLIVAAHAVMRTDEVAQPGTVLLELTPSDGHAVRPGDNILVVTPEFHAAHAFVFSATGTPSGRVLRSAVRPFPWSEVAPEIRNRLR